MVAHIQLQLTSGKRAEENHDNVKHALYDGYRVERSMHTGGEITGRGGGIYNIHTFKQCSLRLTELLVKLWEGCEA